MRIAILTSTAPRHCHLVRQVASRFPVLAVFRETKSFDPRKVADSEADERILGRWFEEFSKTEEAMFGTAGSIEDTGPALLFEVEANSFKSESFQIQLADLNPEVLVVFGTSILPERVFTLCSGIALNLHLGLSPYYRGSATNFWALHDGRPDLVGATIHLLDSGIDSGPIVKRGRPPCYPDDTPHTIGCRTVQVGATLMVEAIAEYFRGNLLAIAQDKEPGRLCRRRDFSAQSIVELERRIEAGMIRQYLASGCDGPVPVITNGS